MTARARGGRGQGGYTLIELMVVTAVLGVTAYSIARFIQSARRSAEQGTASAEMQRRGLRSVENLRGGLQDCVELIANYGDGTADAMVGLRKLVVASVVASENPVPAISSPGAPAPVAFTGWPTVETSAEVGMDGGTSTAAADWGDELMYVAQLNPITFTAYYTYSGSVWSVGGSASSDSTDAEILSVGRLQFVYDYLAWDPDTSLAGGGQGLQLAEWRSQPFIDYTSLSSLSDTPTIYSGTADSTCCPRLTAACDYLVLNGYSLAFDPSCVTLTADCGSCFYDLSPGNISAKTPATEPTSLAMYSWADLDDFDEVQSFSSKPGVDLGRIARANGGAGGQTAGPGGYSVALNTSGTTMTGLSVVELLLPADEGTSQVPAYAEADYSMPDNMGGTGFPAGFETAVDGQFGSREIFVRLMLMVSNSASPGYGIFQAQQEETEISIAPQYDF